MWNVVKSDCGFQLGLSPMFVLVWPLSLLDVVNMLM